MITKANYIDFILEVEPDFRKKYEKHVEYREGKSSLHHDIAAFSHFVEDRLRSRDYKTAPKIFKKVEFLLSENNADGDVQNAFCTSFLENLLNYFTEEQEILLDFVPLLGPKSREYCKAWDKFTGVKTPGLWD